MTVLTMSVDHKIYYSNKGKVPIKDVVKGLLAAEKLLVELKPAIRAVFPDVDIEEINIYLDKLEAGSIVEDLIIDLVFGGEKEYEKFREKLKSFRGNVVGKNDDVEQDTMKQLIGLFLAAAIGSGITWAITSQDAVIPPSVETYNNNIINISLGDGDNALTGQNIVDIVSANTDKKAIAQSAVKFVSPAKEDPEATVSINDRDNLTLKPEFIKDTPKSYTAPVQDEEIKIYSDVAVFIVASDSRNRRKGWTGTVTGIIEGTTKLTLAEDLEPSELHGNLNIRADISVIKKFNVDKKTFEMKEVLIKSWVVGK